MKDILATIRLVLLSLVVCCVIYPALLLAFGQVFVPAKANGSLIKNENGDVVGSSLLAQGFTQPGYFRPRPSAVDYKADATGGSNLSPANPALTDRAKATIDLYGPQGEERLPADLVTASGSGMDPHITEAAARFQAPRVAAARGLAEERVLGLIEQNREGQTLAILGGEYVINVLRLNLSLDRLVRTQYNAP